MPYISELSYSLSAQAVSSQLKYRLMANADGSFPAVQPMEGTVTIIDVERNLPVDVKPGGPVIGFGAGSLVAYGCLLRRRVADRSSPSTWVR